MLSLFVDLNGVKQVELYSAQPVNLNFRFTEIQEINRPAASYSQSFRVPLTPHNADVFGVFDVSLVPSYDYKRRITARLVSEGITLVEGFVQVKSWTITNGRYTDVELAFFGDTASLSRNIGDEKLSTLNTSALDFNLNYAAIQASEAGALGGAALRLGIVDRGYNWTNANFPHEGGSGTLEHTQVTPFISIRKVVDLIFSEAGLTYESDFISEIGVDIYLMLLSSDSLQRTYTIGSEAFGIYVNSNYTFASSGTITLPLADTSAGYDNGGNYNASTYVFTPPYDATYTFLFRMNSSAPTDLQVNASTSGITSVWSGATGLTFFALNVHLVAGESVTFEATANSGTTLYTGGLTQGGTSVILYNFTEDSGVPISVAKNFPDMKRIEFISGLQKNFNLVFIQDKNVPTRFYIEPFSDYMTGGAVKDWSGKLATDKDYVVKPTSDIQKREYRFTHTESEDYANELSRNISGDVHGVLRITDPSSDFAAGTMEIRSPFAPFLPTAIPGSDFVILRLTKDGNSIANPRPMLAYYNGVTQVNVKTLNDSGAPAFMKLPLFSESENFNSDVNSDSLNYGYPRSVREIIATPLNALYYKYWRKFANELYSPDARILEAFFYLDAVDIQAFEWSDRIYLFSSYWRVIEISSYDAVTPGITRVTLLKTLGDIRDCNEIPINGKGGIITFSSPSGVVSGSKFCCERYGYEYDINAKRCTQIPAIL